jgi:hypothetical protein
MQLISGKDYNKLLVKSMQCCILAYAVKLDNNAVF